jgi:hypothetical protein
VGCRRTRLEPIVDGDVATRVQIDAGHLQSNPGGVGCASRRDQDIAAVDELFPARRAYTEADACPRPSLYPEDLRRKQDLDPLVS